jgi:hypothetical protein
VTSRHEKNYVKNSGARTSSGFWTMYTRANISQMKMLLLTEGFVLIFARSSAVTMFFSQVRSESIVPNLCFDNLNQDSGNGYTLGVYNCHDILQTNQVTPIPFIILSLKVT